MTAEINSPQKSTRVPFAVFGVSTSHGSKLLSYHTIVASQASHEKVSELSYTSISSLVTLPVSVGRKVHVVHAHIHTQSFTAKKKIPSRLLTHVRRKHGT